jgi:hypothetical protein
MLYILIFTFLGRRRKTKDYGANSNHGQIRYAMKQHTEETKC